MRLSLTLMFSQPIKPTSVSPQLNLSSTLPQHLFFIYGHSCSSIDSVLFENHSSLFSPSPSLSSITHGSSSSSPSSISPLHLLSLVQSFILTTRLLSLPNPFHRRLFIHLTNCLHGYFWPFNVRFYSAQRLDLFAWCVIRLSQLSVGFQT